MTRRGPRTIAAACLLAAAIAVTGCTPPSATPTPTPTGFADEDAAFAAAEETYRAYVDALNQVDLSDPATFEDVYRWTTGDALAGEKESLSTMHAEGWTVSGETIVESVTGLTYDAEAETGVVLACVNVEDVTLTNASGESVVEPDRPSVQTVEVNFTSDSSTDTGVALSALLGSAEESACST